MADTCFGRRQYLDILHKRVNGLKDGYRQNLALVGDESVGKTTILFDFLNDFCDSRFLMIYLEARQETAQSFCRRFLGSMLYNFLQPLPALREDLDFLVEKSRAYIPETAGKIKSFLADLKKKKPDALFTELLSFPEMLHAESGKFCVVIVDEFQNLERLGAKKLYKEWAQVLMVQKTTMYIIASSTPYKAKAILSKDLSLLFGNFEVVQVEPFDVRTTEQYLDAMLSGLPVDPAARKFIANLSGGNPYYLNIIAGALSAGPDLNGTLESLLFDAEGVLNQRFSALMRRYDEMASGQEYVSILYHVSCGCNKIKDIAHVLRRVKSEIAPRVSYLVENDAIRRSGDFLIINDRLFGFWLRCVYQEKRNSLSHDLTNQRALFRNRIGSMQQEFVLQAGKPFAVRMAELFRLFSDERVQLERKSMRLDRFREIKPFEFGSKRLKEGLICRSSDSVWIMAFSRDGVTEDDIAEFSEECKKYRNKSLRKIIVNLSGFDHNSRLKALEEKIITWDLEKVNEILDLYSRPRIIA
ncbi:MAG: ATP-binding protein [Deltaproteobacteria bacterium]